MSKDRYISVIGLGRNRFLHNGLVRLLCKWVKMYADTMFHYIINEKSSLWRLWEIVVGSSYKPTCPDPSALRFFISLGPRRITHCHWWLMMDSRESLSVIYTGHPSYIKLYLCTQNKKLVTLSHLGSKN